ncbi:MAG: hypothetical protein JXA82_17965 [Sedimentisphaerales bacterium]|nr:hypothetical protein [Sedimentisphaerales bacterium]
MVPSLSGPAGPKSAILPISRILVDVLCAQGVEVVFGYCGAAVLPLLDAFFPGFFNCPLSSAKQVPGWP